MNTDPLFRLTAALADRYRIERELGQGGMATVYLAEDVRHHRKVAIKVLHPELSAVLGPDRFLKEIELTASLQHPHILPLFDSGNADGLLFYVMPYVEGETLRNRLEREHQLPINDAIRIATEVADALEYAHKSGVIHRDIKPENILLHDGRPLVADFGIALAVQHAGGSRMTQTGMSLGTPQYMAPEQAMGDKGVDARADIYALGVVTYEMLAGEPPFIGPTAQAIVAKVMTEDPRPLIPQRRSIPPHVEAAVFTALEKLPADRFASASQLAQALADPALSRGVPHHSVSPASLRGVPFRAVAAALVVVLVIGLGLEWLFRSPPQSAQPSIVRFIIEADSGFTIRESPAISPDGKVVVYRMDAPTGSQLYYRRLDELVSHPIAGSEDGYSPFFSPDGASIGFATDQELKKVGLDGSSLATLAHLQTVLTGGVWVNDNTIVYATWPDGLFKVVEGGTPARVSLKDSTFYVVSLSGIPGQSTVLFTGVSLQTNLAWNGALDLVSGQVRLLGEGIGPRYIPGFLVYANRRGQILRQPFDPERMDTTGPATQIADNVSVLDEVTPLFSIGQNGTLVVVPGQSENRVLSEFDWTGQATPLITGPGLWVPRVSPDGSRIAYGAYPPNKSLADIWIYDRAAGTRQRVTFEGEDSNDPSWSPDGESLLFSANRDSTIKDLYILSVSGSGVRPLLRREHSQWNSDWSHDGRSVLFTEVKSGHDWSIWSVPAAGGPEQPYVVTPFREMGARFSPNGRWVAYTSNETGRYEVYIQSFPVPGQKTVVSAGGGRDPVWSSDGRKLFYLQGNQLMAASLTISNVVGVTARAPLFEANYVIGPHANYDIYPDGRHFVMLTAGDIQNRMVVTLNSVAPR